MTAPLVAVVSVTRRPVDRPYLTSAWDVRLACGHVVVKRPAQDGALPKRRARCRECAR